VGRVHYLEEEFDFGNRVGLRVPGRLYVPEEATPEPRPAVLYFHDSGRGAEAELQAQNGRLLGTFIDQGLAVLAIDAPGFGSWSLAESRIGAGHDRIHESAIAWGFTLTDLALHDELAALDILRSVPGIDPGRIALVGQGWGAARSHWIAAFRRGQIRGVLSLGGIRRLQDAIDDASFSPEYERTHDFPSGALLERLDRETALLAAQPLEMRFAVPRWGKLSSGADTLVRALRRSPELGGLLVIDVSQPQEDWVTLQAEAAATWLRTTLSKH
jgi:hypothetical protein